MKTLGRNADNDLYLEGNDLAIVSDADAQCAIIESVLQTQQGELQFDDNAGIDYFGTVFQNPSYIAIWAAQVRTKIEALDFVSSIEDFTYKFDRPTSTLIWSMTVINTDNDRLELKDKKTSLASSPGVDIDWDNIYDKPEGITEAISLVEGMRDEARAIAKEASGGSEDLKSPVDKTTTLARVKNILNQVIFDPTDEEYAKSREIQFTLSSVPIGTVIDFSNLKVSLNPVEPFTVKISDGTENWIQTKFDGSALDDTENQVWFEEDKGSSQEGRSTIRTQTHTILTRGDITISLKGNITGIGSFDSTKPIFLNSKQEGFGYFTMLTVGERVPLASIGDGAFRDLKNFQKVVWNENSEVSTVSFGAYSFANCVSFTDLQWLPNNVSLNEGTFMGCTGVTSFVGAKEENGIARKWANATAIPAHCFEGCTRLQSLAGLPSTLTTVGERAFANCISLKGIKGLPDSITTFGVQAFAGCTGITSVLYPPSSLAAIGAECFKDCTSLDSLYIGASTATIGSEAFKSCSKLTNIMSERGTRQDGGDLPRIESDTFPDANQGVKIYVHPNMLKAYKAATYLDGQTEKPSNWHQYAANMYAFAIHEFTLQNVEEGLSLIGTTSKITSDSIWTIQYYEGDTTPKRFARTTTALPEYLYPEVPQDGSVSGNAIITLKGYVRQIEAASNEAYPIFTTGEGVAFDNLTSVNIYDTPTSGSYGSGDINAQAPLNILGDYAFAQCPNLGSVSLGNENSQRTATPYRLGERTFWECKALTSAAFLTAGLGQLTDASGNTYDAFGEGCFYNSGLIYLDFNAINVKSLPAYCFAGTQIEELDWKDAGGIEKLGDHCFFDCKKLESISGLASTSVTALPEYCFAHTVETDESSSETEAPSLTSLEGIAEITSLGGHVFEGCSALENISALANKEAGSEIDTLPEYAFAGCSSITSLDGILNDGTPTTTTIRSIGEYCFSGCRGLTDIKAFKYTNITAIPTGCFSECASLKTLIGCEHVASIGEYAFAECKGLRSTSGLGFDVASIGNYAFQNCTGLYYVSCVATSVPTISSTAFDGVDVSNVPLYVPKGLVSSYSSYTDWKIFQTISARSISITYQNLLEITGGNNGAAAKTRIEAFVYDPNPSDDSSSDSSIGGSSDSTVDNTIAGIWCVDYGDGTAPEFHYANEKSLSAHTYASTGDYTITLYGDITSFNGYDAPGSSVEKVSFLDDIKGKASTISISSSYLLKIDKACFLNYGQAGRDLSVSLDTSAEIGEYAFAKGDGYEEYGVIRTLEVCGAKVIGANAFLSNKLEDTSAFSSVEEVGDSAFAYNTSLTSLDGFSALKTIGDNAFEGCTGLTEISGLGAAESIGNSAFLGCTNVTVIKGFSNSLATIEASAFAGCPNIHTIFMAATIPPCKTADGETAGIATNVFEKTVRDSAMLYVPAGSVEISGESISIDALYARTNGWSAFSGRITVRSISFRIKNVKANDRIAAGLGTVTASGPWTISYGPGEDVIAGEEGTTTLGAYTFKDSHLDAYITISGPITSIACSDAAYPIFGSEVGKNVWITEIETTSAMELTSFGTNTFKGCSALESVNDVSSVTTIGDSAFENCVALTNIEGLYNVTTIGESAFAGCNKLSSIYGLHNVTTIGASAFRGCGSLKKLDGFGTGLTSIGASAFDSCPLEEVQIFAQTPPTLGADAFNGVDLETTPLYVRTKSINAYRGDSSWNVFANIQSRYIEFNLTNCPANTTVVAGRGKVWSDTYWVVDWDAYSGEGFPSRSGVETLMPGHTYSLAGNNTFRLEGAVTKIAAAGTVTVVGETASPSTPSAYQAHYSLPDVGITPVPTGARGGGFVTIESIGDSYLLTKVSASDNAVLTEIGDGTFINNKALETVSLSGLTAIGIGAFANDSSLLSLEFLGSVSEIKDYAFFQCTSITQVKPLAIAGGGVIIGSQAFGIYSPYTDGGVKYYSPKITGIRIGTIEVAQAIINEISFGVFGKSIDKHSNVTVYVPQESVSAYQGNSEWGKFKIASQLITFTLKDVPSGTTIIGISRTDSIGTAKILTANNSPWAVDWGDGSSDSMTSAETTYPAHTYEYVEGKDEYHIWTRRTVDGVDSWYAPVITISLSGDIQSISCQSPTNSPFLATERGVGNPYLTAVVASDGMENLTTIGEYAFQGCTALTTVSSFTHVTSIGDYAFQGCTNLSNLGGVTANEYKEDDRTVIELSGTGFLKATEIGTSAFADCSNLTNLMAFPSVTNIGVRAFANCQSLSSISGLGLAYKYTPIITDSSGREIRVTFGAFAFTGCYFGFIDVENYIKPPVIQTTTFPGEPANTLVYTSLGIEGDAAYSADAILQAYKTAPVWMLYYQNIISAAPITITFAASQIIGGVALKGNCKIYFTGSYVAVDWGDGNVQQANPVEDESGTSTIPVSILPDHIYPYDLAISGPISIKLRGAIQKIESIDKNKPCVYLMGSYYTTQTAVYQPGNTEDKAYKITTTRYETRKESGNSKKFVHKDPIIVSTVDKPTNAVTTTPPAIYTGDGDDGEVLDAEIDTFKVGDGTSFLALGASCFIKSGVKNVEIGFPQKPQGEVQPLVTIGANAFQKCSILTIVKSTTKLENGKLSAAIGEVGMYSFDSAVALTDIKFLRSTTTIGDYAFRNCTSLTNTDGLDSVIEIGHHAFYFTQQPSLERITLPKTLRSIGDQAFYNATRNLVNNGGVFWEQDTELDGGNAAITIGRFAFGSALPEGTRQNQNWGIYIPSQVHRINPHAFQGSKMSLFSWGCSTYPDTSADGYYLGENEEGGDDGSGSTIQDNGYAFNNCENLTKVYFLPQIAAIPPQTFVGCKGLTSYVGVGRYVVKTFNAQQNEYEYSYEEDNANPNADNAPFKLPTSIKSIGDGAFLNSQLTYGIDLSACSNLETIGDYAFRNCSDGGMNLQVVILPSSVTSLGKYAFRDSSIKEFTWPVNTETTKTVGEGCFSGCSKLTTVHSFGGAQNLSEAKIFYGCTSLTSESFGVILANVTNNTLGNYCFALCTSLGVVTIPINIATLGECCFSCASWIEMNSSGNLVTLRSKLDSIIYQLYRNGQIPRSSSTAQTDSLDNWEKVTYGVTLEDGTEIPGLVDSAGNQLGSLTSITFGASSVTLGEGCFLNCKQLATVTAPLLKLGTNINTFAGCSSLATINVNDFGENGVPAYCFCESSSLTTLKRATTGSTTLVSILSIGDYAFYQCRALASVAGISSCNSIGQCAFWQCTALSSLHILPILGDEQSIKALAFGECTGLTSLSLGKIKSLDWGYIDIGASDSSDSTISIKYPPWGACSRLWSISILGLPTVTSGLFDKAVFDMPYGPASATSLQLTLEGVELIEERACKGNSKLATLTLNVNTTNGGTIGEQAFANCGNLHKVILNNIVFIGKGAFSSCNLSPSLSLTGTKATTIEESVFEGCSKLTEVSITTVRRIAKKAFKNCTNLQTISIQTVNEIEGPTSISIEPNIPNGDILVDGYTISVSDDQIFAGCTSLTTIKIQNVGSASTGKIGMGAFAQLPIQNLFINQVIGNTGIDAYAFAGCTNLMAIRKYDGTTSVGSQITKIQDYAFFGCTTLQSLGSLRPSASTDDNNLTYVGKYAFAKCRLQNGDGSERLGKNVAKIDDYAFAGNGALTRVIRMSSTPEMGVGVYKGCSSLQYLTGLACKGDILPRETFADCTSLLNLATMPSSIVGYGDYCFKGCTNLKSVANSGNPILSAIGNGCFEGCSSVTRFAGFSYVYTYPVACFKDCTSLAAIGRFNAPGKTGVFGQSGGGGDGNYVADILFLPSLCNIPTNWYVTQIDIDQPSGTGSNPYWGPTKCMIRESTMSIEEALKGKNYALSDNTETWVSNTIATHSFEFIDKYLLTSGKAYYISVVAYQNQTLATSAANVRLKVNTNMPTTAQNLYVILGGVKYPVNIKISYATQQAGILQANAFQGCPIRMIGYRENSTSTISELTYDDPPGIESGDPFPDVQVAARYLPSNVFPIVYTKNGSTTTINDASNISIIEGVDEIELQDVNENGFLIYNLDGTFKAYGSGVTSVLVNDGNGVSTPGIPPLLSRKNVNVLVPSTKVSAYTENSYWGQFNIMRGSN